MTLYAEQYTLEEFGLLNAFYSSPLGQKGKQVDVAIGPEVFDLTFLVALLPYCSGKINSA